MSVPPDAIQSFQASDVVNWLRENCFSNAKHQSLVPWRFVFPFALWELWKHRNKVSFENNPLNPNLCRLCINQAMEYYFCVGKIREQRSMAVIVVRWKKPPLNWYKLNTYGASCGNWIRDSAGNWIRGFARNIGYTTSIIAEFWTLRDGLQLAIQLGVQNLEVELDAKVIVDLINSKNSSNTAYSSLFLDCILLLEMVPHTKVKHVFQKANKCADALVRIGCHAHEEFVIFDGPPSMDVSAVAYADEIGESFCRQVVANLAILTA